MEFCPVPPPYGGATVFVKRLSDRLRADGYTVGGYYTSACRDKALLESPVYFLAEECDSSSRVRRACAHLLRMYRNACQIKPFSIVHYHGLENMKFIWFLHRYMRKKIVITVHSAMIESFYRRTDRVNKHYMQKLAYSDVQWIAVSTQARDCMERLPFRFKLDIPVIAAYVPNEEGPSAPLASDMSEYIAGHDKIIAFYGRSFMLNDGVDVYGFDIALEMYSRIVAEVKDRVGFVFCLSDDSEKDKIELLHRKARELGIDDRIYWQIGAIDNMKSLWEKTDVYVRPTSTDGDSVAVREVIGLGVRVVATDVCPRPEEVILFRYNDLEDFIEKVKSAVILGKRDRKVNDSYYKCMRGMFDKILSVS